jgi:transposase
MTRRKRYSAEFKREALRRANEEGVTDTLVAEELGLVPDNCGVGAMRRRSTATKHSPARAMRKLAKIEQERDFLKEAAVRSTGQCNTLHSGKEKRSVTHGKNGQAWPHRRAESRTVGTMEERRIA